MSAHQPRVSSSQLQELYQKHYNNHNRSMTTIITENMGATKTQKNAKHKDEFSFMPTHRSGQSSMQPSAGPSPAATKQVTPHTHASQPSTDSSRIRFNMMK